MSKNENGFFDLNKDQSKELEKFLIELDNDMLILGQAQFEAIEHSNCVELKNSKRSLFMSYSDFDRFHKQVMSNATR